MNSSVLGSLVIMGLGLLLAAGASIVVLINAFRQHVGWFFVVFFLPLGNIIFACVHWAETKVSFVLSFVGIAMMFGGAFAVPEVRDLMMKDVKMKFGIVEQPKAPDLTTQIQEHRNKLELLQGTFAQDGITLTKEYQQLDAQRKALKPGDTGAVTKFNEAAAAYQAKNTARKQMQQQMDTVQKELDGLLEARSRNAATNSASSKKVVMYTTSHCPACKAAKQYFAQKGVNYEEIDVEASRSGYEAFQKLGGHGVPLILVGDKRMDGFSAAALDAML